jgi:hypothetical protein
VTLLVLNLFFLDVNITSPHGFFRDRLSKVFVVGLEGGQLVPRDKLKLSELNAEKNLSAVAPYHLINAALNLAGSTDVDLRGRDADFFLFSKRFVGSERTGYCPTPKMEDADPHLDLATAMAISAAAASPQMGAMSELREFAPLLALANVRLSYWLPNPVYARKLSGVGAWAVRPGVRYLIKEALGKTDERARFVNVSDGGHIENLGVYQLLRRHCRLIIAVDGEEDRHHQFGALVTLMRYAWIDMGIQIDIDLDPLRLVEHGTSARHWAVGTIHYRTGETGTLVYLKASVSGNEGEVIRDYRRRQPDFPHESTADQFFTEAQFEAYRALGAHIAEDCWHAMVSDPTRIGHPSPREPSAPS